MSTSAYDSDIFDSKVVCHIKNMFLRKKFYRFFPCALGIDEKNNIIVVRWPKYSVNVFASTKIL
jgi:hypothetical protein